MGNVYFFKAGDLVKVGFSKNVERRRLTFQTAIGQPLECLAVLEGCTPSIERIYHRALADREYFIRRRKIAKLLGLPQRRSVNKIQPSQATALN